VNFNTSGGEAGCDEPREKHPERLAEDERAQTKKETGPGSRQGGVKEKKIAKSDTGTNRNINKTGKIPEQKRQLCL